MWRISLLLLALHYQTVNAVGPISVKGTKLYRENGQQFFIKGAVPSVAGLFPASTAAYIDKALRGCVLAGRCGLDGEEGPGAKLPVPPLQDAL